MSQVVHQCLSIVNFKFLAWHNASATRKLNYFSHAASPCTVTLLLFLGRIIVGLEQIQLDCFLARK
jgi:heme A synthase